MRPRSGVEATGRTGGIYDGLTAKTPSDLYSCCCAEAENEENGGKGEKMMKRVIQISLDVLVEENYEDLISHIKNSVEEKGFEVCGIQQTDASWTLEEYSKITGWKESNKVRIPYPYNLYFKVVEEGEEVEGDYKIGDEIKGYGCHLLAYLEPFNEECYCYPILTDDKDYPVVELVSGRLYPVDVKNLK